MKCGCGCGEEVREGRRYIHSHHLRQRSEETKRLWLETRRANAALSREAREGRIALPRNGR